MAGEKGDIGEQGVPGSDGALAGLTCLDQQFIAQFNGAWKCAELGTPFNGVLSGSIVDNSYLCCELSDWATHGSYYGLIGSYPCNQNYCYFGVLGVADHTSCTVSGAVGNLWFITTSPGVTIENNAVLIYFSQAVGNDLDYFPPSTPVSIQVSCGQGIVPANNITPV